MSFLETADFWLSICVIGGGGGAVWAMYKFGRSLTEREFERWFNEYWHFYLLDNQNLPDRQQLLQEFSDMYKGFLRERNDFWDKYGQVLIAISIIVVLTVLLLTRTISPEAGLPVLSGVGGFAIAKSTNLNSSNRPRGPGPGSQ